VGDNMPSEAQIKRYIGRVLSNKLGVSKVTGKQAEKLSGPQLKKLKEYIENQVDPSVTKKIINMTADEYERYLISLSSSNTNLIRDEFYPLYSNRLLNVIKFY